MARAAHDILGIPRGADERTVRRAYRSLLFELEDVSQSLVDYPQRLEELETAFATCLAQASSEAPATSATSILAERPKRAAISAKLASRLAIGLFAIAALFFGWQLAKDKLVDPFGDSPVDTVGMIAAIEDTPTGARAVAFRADGSKVAAPAGPAGSQDAEVVWRPDGNRLLLIANREGASYDVHRWDVKGNRVESRSPGGRSKSSLWYGPVGWPELSRSGLLVAGSFVFDYDQRAQTLAQVLPPLMKERRAQATSGEGEGSVGQIEAMYKEIGTGFRAAKWGKDRKWVWAVMSSEDGEALVYQSLSADTPQGRLPVKIIGASRISFDVDAEGQAVVLTHGPAEPLLDRTIGYGEKYAAVLQKLEEKDGAGTRLGSESEQQAVKEAIESRARASVVKEERAAKIAQVYVCSIGQDGAPFIQPLYGLAGEGRTLTDIAVSVANQRIALVMEIRSSTGVLESQGLVLLTAGKPPQPMLQGDIAGLSWSPDGERVVFTRKTKSGGREILVLDATAEKLTKVGREGAYRSPKFSPQVQAPK